MSRSDRKRNSKWDLTEDSRAPHENMEGNGPRRSGIEDNDMKSKHDLGYGSREPLPGSRGSHKYDSIQEGRGRHLKATGTWERDEGYNMRMSPGLDEWRQRSRSRSPKNNWSRPIRSRSKSRSRSPIRGYRREAGNFDRDRSRSGQLCKDFASGRCRRGNHCPFIHQISENYDDSGETKRWKDGGVSKYSSPREATRDYPTRGGRSTSPREVRDYPTRGGRSTSPREVRDYPTRGGRSPSPRGARDYPTRGGRSPSPRGARDYPTRGGRSPSPRGARDYPTRGGRSPSPRGARDYPTRGGRSPSPREAMDYPARSGRSSEMCNNFLKGKCFRGASCRYVHDGASDGFDKGPTTEVLRERDNDRYSRDASFDRGVRSGSDIPCRFFTAGNCRNGRNCRFSHNGQAQHASPDRRPRDDRHHHGPDDENQLWDAPKWSDPNAVSDAAMLNEEKHDKLGLRDVNQVWDGPKWSDVDTTSDAAAKLSEDKRGVHEPSTTGWSNNDRWGLNLVNENKVACDPTVIHKPAESYKKEATQWNEQGTGDMEMSPEWNYAVPSANHLRKEEHDYAAVQSSQPLSLNHLPLSTHEQNMTQLAPVPNLAAAASILPISNEKSYFHHNPNLMGAGPTLLSCEGKEGFDRTASSGIDLNCATTVLPGQSFEQNGRGSNANAVISQSVFTDHQRGLSSINSQDQDPYAEGKLVHRPDMANANASQVNPPTQNVVTSEQLTQLTNISASLAKLLENGQELPKLYAALNPQNLIGAPSVTNPQGPFPPVSAASASQKQYDPMYDSMDLEKPEINITPPGFSANHIKQDTSAIFVDGKLKIPANAGGPSGNNESQPAKQPDTDASCGVIAQDNGGGADKSKKAPKDTNKNENGPLENVEKDGGADEGKKSKDTKGIRAFKFALVELVKELLKPSWKEGKIEKENYKTIVKKVVDKVTGTIQAANIPQTSEKIEQYLSFSKPKLIKLIQAYVDKFQKGKD